MRKIIFALMLIASITMYGQTSELNKWVKKTESTRTQQKTTQPAPLEDASVLLNKSATYQYIALGSGGAAAGLALTASLIGTKDYSNETAIDKYDSDRKLRKGLYIGAGILAATAICLEIVAIDYKMKAGHKIKLYSTGVGGGLAYVF